MADEAQIGAGGRVKRQPSRGMYVLPSLFTAGNMAAGYYAITQSIQGSAADQAYFDRAALALGIAVPVRWARWHDCTHDQYRERLRQGAGLAGRRDYIWSCAKSAGLHLGFPHAAGDGASATPRTTDAYRDLRMLHLSHLWGESTGTVQYQHQSTAAQSRAAG